MNSRVINTKRNIIASFLLMSMQIVFAFVSRAVIIYTLGEEYLGLSSLFSSILQTLNIAELGFTVSIVYFMYKPIADGNNAKVCALLAFLRKVYFVVGGIIFIVGIIIIPLLPHLIKGSVPEDINIFILYILYLTNTSISYIIFAYPTALLTALQRLDLTKFAACLVTFIQYLFQLLALLLFHNYYLFVVIMILGTAFINLYTAYISKLNFPQYTCTGSVSGEDRQDIAAKVKGLLVCNISNVTYTSLDSIVISAFIGLRSVAIYNNYIYIYTAVYSLITLIRSAMQSSVGNSVASESLDKNYNDLELWQFLFSVISTWCASCMICLYQPVMTLWMGSSRLLPYYDVVLIIIWFIISAVQHSFYLYLSAFGIWNELKLSYIGSTLFNLILNIILGKYLGITGIIIASLLSSFIFGTIIQCWIIIKLCFKRSPIVYIIKQCKYFLQSVIVISVTYLLSSIINMNGLLNILVKGIIAATASLILLLAFCYKSAFFTRSKELLIKSYNRQ